MSAENQTVVVEVPSAETDAVKEGTDVAREIVDTAKKLADDMRGDEYDRAIVLSRLDDLIRGIDTLRESNDARHAEILARLDEIRAAQIVDTIADDIEEAAENVVEEVAETQAPAVIVENNQAADGAEIEKETVEPSVAEKREEKKSSRRWL